MSTFPQSTSRWSRWALAAIAAAALIAVALRLPPEAPSAAGGDPPPKLRPFLDDFLDRREGDGRTDKPAASGEAPTAPKPVATIADLMRSVVAPTGVRGSLAKALELEPKDDRAWQRVRANAALIAEAGGLLQTRKPQKGTLDHWHRRTRALTDAAGTVVTAADQKDYQAALRGMVLLAEQCAPCHDTHR
jgi:hypothetical protein